MASPPPGKTYVYLGRSPVLVDEDKKDSYLAVGFKESPSAVRPDSGSGSGGGSLPLNNVVLTADEGQEDPVLQINDASDEAVVTIVPTNDTEDGGADLNVIAGDALAMLYARKQGSAGPFSRLDLESGSASNVKLEAHENVAKISLRSANNQTDPMMYLYASGKGPVLEVNSTGVYLFSASGSKFRLVVSEQGVVSTSTT